MSLSKSKCCIVRFSIELNLLLTAFTVKGLLVKRLLLGIIIRKKIVVLEYQKLSHLAETVSRIWVFTIIFTF